MTRIVQQKMSLLPEIVDAHDLLNDVVILYREQLQEAGVTLAIDAAADSHYVRADPVRVRQVLWNLLNNAVRNSAPGGQVMVRTSNRTPEWLTVTVIDTGRGIEPDLLARIFTFFVQDDETRRRGVGLGLGLPISKAIIEAHGGRISAASAGRGHGATFTVELPTAAKESAPASVTRRARAVPTQAKTVLLVEDNEDSAAAMAEFLRLHGYEVRIASTLREALDQVEGTDLLVSDIALPDGTGHELMEQINSQRPMPGIALSGYGSADDARRSAAAGFMRHIVKPVDPGELLGAIDELCGR
jgi:CheY-like chemotaxis protein